MKKGISIFLASMFTISMLASCSQPVTKTTSDNATTSETKTETKETTPNGKTSEISVMIFDRGNAPQGEGTVDNNRWTKYINEEMGKQGISVKFVPVPRSEENQKIPVMMASKTAADIMLTYNSANVEQWYQQGGVTDITEAFEAEGKELADYLGEEVLKFGVDENGKRFAVPARRAITANINAFIRKDWLDKLGLAIPTSPDELYNALKQFKEKDPGGVGSDKVIAFGGSGANDGNLLSMAYFNLTKPEDYTTYNAGVASGGYIVFTYQDKGYEDFLRFKNKLYNEGLTDPEYFTSQFSQKEKEAFVAGTLGYWETDVAANVDLTRGGLLQTLRQNVPDADMVAIPPFKNLNDGNQYVPVYAPIGAYNFIPKTARDVNACMKYLNFLAGEGGRTIYFGLEGVNYKMEDNVPVPIDKELNLMQLEWIKNDLFLIGNSGYFKNENDFVNTNALNLDGMFADYYKTDYEYALMGTRLTHSVYTSPTQLAQSGNLDKVQADYRVKLTTCKPEQFDAIMAEFKAELEKYDIKKIIQEREDYYKNK